MKYNGMVTLSEVDVVPLVMAPEFHIKVTGGGIYKTFDNQLAAEIEMKWLGDIGVDTYIEVRFVSTWIDPDPLPFRQE